MKVRVNLYLTSCAKELTVEANTLAAQECLRKSTGDWPVQRLKARLNALCSENPH